MNTFMNFVKKSLAGGGMKGGVGAIAKDGSLNVILPNGLANPLGIELLEL